VGKKTKSLYGQLALSRLLPIVKPQHVAQKQNKVNKQTKKQNRFTDSSLRVVFFHSSSHNISPKTLKIF
jgi:hypothetical protein